MLGLGKDGCLPTWCWPGMGVCKCKCILGLRCPRHCAPTMDQRCRHSPALSPPSGGIKRHWTSIRSRDWQLLWVLTGQSSEVIQVQATKCPSHLLWVKVRCWALDTSIPWLGWRIRIRMLNLHPYIFFLFFDLICIHKVCWTLLSLQKHLTHRVRLNSWLTPV